MKLVNKKMTTEVNMLSKSAIEIMQTVLRNELSTVEFRNMWPTFLKIAQQQHFTPAAPKLVDLSSWCKIAGCSRSYGYKLIEIGLLKPVMFGTLKKYRVSDIEKIIEMGGQEKR